MHSVEAIGIDTLDSDSIDDWIGGQDPFGAKDCTLDMRGIRFITPAALVQLAAVCHGLARTSRCPLIILGDRSVQSYMTRANFMSAVERVARFSPVLLRRSYVPTRGGNAMLIEVTRIQSEAELPGILTKVVTILCDELGYRQRDAFDVAIAISEVAQNTFDHNGHTCGFLAMQVYKRAAGRALEIGVADYGVGLAATLQRNLKNPQLTSDVLAIKYATQRGTSEHDDATRGTGLYHLLDIAYAHDGSVQIRTGEAKVLFSAQMRAGRESPVYHLPGVHIALLLKAK